MTLLGKNSLGNGRVNLGREQQTRCVRAREQSVEALGAQGSQLHPHSSAIVQESHRGWPHCYLWTLTSDFDVAQKSSFDLFTNIDNVSLAHTGHQSGELGDQVALVHQLPRQRSSQGVQQEQGVGKAGDPHRELQGGP